LVAVHKCKKVDRTLASLILVHPVQSDVQ